MTAALWDFHGVAFFILDHIDDGCKDIYNVENVRKRRQKREKTDEKEGIKD